MKQARRIVAGILAAAALYHAAWFAIPVISLLLLWRDAVGAPATPEQIVFALLTACIVSADSVVAAGAAIVAFRDRVSNASLFATPFLIYLSLLGVQAFFGSAVTRDSQYLGEWSGPIWRFIASGLTLVVLSVALTISNPRARVEGQG